MAGGLQVTLAAVGIGGDPAAEGERRLIEVEVHGAVVDQRRLVKVDVEAIVGLHLEGCLHAGVGEAGLRQVALATGTVDAADLGEARGVVVIFLRVVVARDPECHVVARHGELGQLLPYHEVDQLLLLRKLIAKTEAVVKQAETDDHCAAGLLLREAHGQLVMVIADGTALAPYRLPGLVDGGSLRCGQCKPIVKRGAGIAALAHLLTEPGIAAAGQLQPQATGTDHLPALVAEAVGGDAPFLQGKL